MKMTKQEYEDMIRKRPSLAPLQDRPKVAVKRELYGLGECVTQVYEVAPEPTSIEFTIPGQPVGKPRMTQRDKWMKRRCVMRYREWADRARASMPTWAGMPFGLTVEMKIYMEFPKSYSKKRRLELKGVYHDQKPDLDNLIKCLDAIFPEDKRIWKIIAEKRWEDGLGARMEVRLY